MLAVVVSLVGQSVRAILSRSALGISLAGGIEACAGAGVAVGTGVVVGVLVANALVAGNGDDVAVVVADAATGLVVPRATGSGTSAGVDGSVGMIHRCSSAALTG